MFGPDSQGETGPSLHALALGVLLREDANAHSMRAGEAAGAEHSRVFQLARRQRQYDLVQRTHRGTGRHIGTETEVVVVVVVVIVLFSVGGDEEEKERRFVSGRRRRGNGRHRRRILPASVDGNQSGGAENANLHYSSGQKSQNDADYRRHGSFFLPRILTGFSAQLHSGESGV